MEQFSLRGEPLEKKKEFLRKIYSAEILYSLRCFIKMGRNREEDPTMTLDKFLDSMREEYVALKVHVGEEFPGETLRKEYDAMPAGQKEGITFIRIACLTGLGDSDLRAEYTCPYNQQNYDAVKRIVAETFGHDLEEFDAWQLPHLSR